MPKENYKSYKNIGKALEEVAGGLMTVKKWLTNPYNFYTL